MQTSKYNTNSFTKSDLSKTETKIRKSLKSFQTLGESLAFIQDNDLHVLKDYDPGYKGFIKYCNDTFYIKQAYIYKMINAYTVCKIFQDNNIKELPGTESQCRPITRFLKDHYPEDIADCWHDFVNKYNDGLCTWSADSIKKHFNEHFGIKKTDSNNAETESKSGNGSAGNNSDTDSSGTGTDSNTDSDSNTSNADKLEIERLKQLLAASEAEKQFLQEKLRTRTNSSFNPDLSSPIAKKLFKAGFRKLAAELHPDKGGSTQDMQELLELKSKLGI